MTPPSLWSRIRKGRLVQVLAVYVGVSWVVLQVVGSLHDLLQLPPWVGPVTMILLAVGLVIIVATAWVQSHPLVADRAQTDQVPGSWELDLSEAVETVSRGKMPHLTWARAMAGGVIAFSLLFGVAGLYVVIKDRGAAFAPNVAMAEEAPDGIAVLPFTVRGAALDEWREGMVDLLATGLDGAGGVRAIASRTVLARWDEMVADSPSVDARLSLDVARRTGARYAVLGSAVAIGPNVRLVAEVYGLHDEVPLGPPVQVEGHPDDVLALVDELAVKALGLILGSDASLPHVDLASVTTPSLPALKAYLEGETLFRSGDFAGATEAFERAVREDSLFGLSYFRLSQALGWSEGIGSDRSSEADERALALIDRLPQREAAIVRGANAVRRFQSESASTMQEVVRKYPDDPEAWYLLGEANLHVRETLGGWEEAEHAFERAVQLAPQFAPYRIHLIEAAARFHADGARLETHLAEYERLAAGSPMLDRYRLVQKLAFGDSITREAALAEAEEIPPGAQLRQVTYGLNNPVFWETQERMLRSAQRRVPPAAQVGIRTEIGFGSLFKRGHARKAVEELRGPGMPTWAKLDLGALAHEFGFTAPTEELDDAVARAVTGPIEGEAAFAVALAAATRGEWTAHERAVARMRVTADSMAAAGDSTGFLRTAANARVLDGYGLWKRGQTARAIEVMDAAREDARNEAARWWLGQMHLELGRLREAERYFRSLNTWDPDPLSSYQLGKIYDQTGERDKARAMYEFFVVNWATADPELQPLVDHARTRLADLSPDRSR